jgi:hypothetical protein
VYPLSFSGESFAVITTLYYTEEFITKMAERMNLKEEGYIDE